MNTASKHPFSVLPFYQRENSLLVLFRELFSTSHPQQPLLKRALWPHSTNNNQQKIQHIQANWQYAMHLRYSTHIHITFKHIEYKPDAAKSQV